jgi:hypothetical protein
MTLTREEILSRTPGPELDALIAEHVMGWTTSESWDGRYWVDADKCSRYEKKEFKPSQYINIAWEVVTHLMNDHKDVIVQCVSFEVNRLFDCAIYEHKEELAVTTMLGSAPEAIGKAALLAVLNL